MPKRYTKRTAAKAIRRMAKRFLRRKRHRRKKLPLTGFPSKKLCRLRYCDTIWLDPTATGVDSHYFCSNGLYDTDITGTGHQPLGFDQWMTIYNHYNVLGARIKMTPLIQNETASASGYYGIILDDNTTFSYTSGPEIIESKQGKGAVLLTNMPANKPKSAWRSFSSKKFFGHSALEDSNKGSSSANPTEKAYFGTWMSSITSSDPTGVNFMIEIEYIVLFTEPKFLAQS